MILQALYELAQRENLVDDPDFEIRPVAWLVHVGPGGEFRGIVGTHSIPESESGKKKPRPVPARFRLPLRLPSRSGSKPQAEFLADNAQFVFGLGTPDKPVDSAKAKARTAGFRDRLAACAEATKDEGLVAVQRFLDDLHAGRFSVTLPPETLSNEVFAFVYAPDRDRLVSDRPVVEAYWRDQRAHSNEGVGAGVRCLVSGKSGAMADKHPKIMKLPGGNTAGAALISFNKGAFESQGWSVNENAPISRDAAEACAAALNRLLHPTPADPVRPGLTLPRRNYRISGDTAVCYWAASKTDFLDVFEAILEAREEQVGEMYRSVWRGRPVGVDDPSAFYALTISGAQGRAVIRDWFESTVSAVAGKLAQHFDDLNIVRNTPKPQKGNLAPNFPLTLLLQSLTPEGDRNQIPPAMASQLLQSALSGRPYRVAILQRAIERYRADIGRTEWADSLRRDARAALVKAFLNRWKRFNPNTTSYEEIKPEMDPNNESPGYLLGQLMAVLERIQQAALKDVNASVIDRYFSGASAAPRAVFVRLLKNSQHHARKAMDDPAAAGLVFRLERLKDELSDRFDPKHNGFPARLNMEQQGLFVLGYHQMRKWIWMNQQEREQWEAVRPVAPRAYLWNRKSSE
jgi:CRISPR-associated protein Csd1